MTLFCCQVECSEYPVTLSHCHTVTLSHVLLSGGVLRVPGPEAGEEVRRGAPADLRQAEAHPGLQRGHQAHLQGGAMSIVVRL